jgi:hypothetical protein
MNLDNYLFLLFGKDIRAKDGDTHTITAKDLVKLYNLPEKQCVYHDRNISHWYRNYFYEQVRDKTNKRVIVLEPCENGNYQQTLELKLMLERMNVNQVIKNEN